MTLIATWHPTEEQKCEFEEIWRRVYNSQIPSPVSKVEIREYTQPYTGELYAEVHFQGYPFTWYREFIVAELIKAGYFVL